MCFFQMVIFTSYIAYELTACEAAQNCVPQFSLTLVVLIIQMH
jgi:hypothetical protein